MQMIRTKVMMTEGYDFLAGYKRVRTLQERDPGNSCYVTKEVLAAQTKVHVLGYSTLKNKL